MVWTGVSKKFYKPNFMLAREKMQNANAFLLNSYKHNHHANGVENRARARARARTHTRSEE